MQYRSVSAAAIPAQPPTAFPRRRPQLSRQQLRIRAILDGLRWRRQPVEIDPPVVTVAEIAECGCPDLCNRDHDND
jgi:hypothetical protein